MTTLKLLDENIFQILNSFVGVSSITDTLVIFFAQYLGYFVVIGLLFFLKQNRVSILNRAYEAQIFIIATLIISSGIMKIVKLFYQRPRPYLTLMMQELFIETSFSFPSGHATFFFALATAVYIYNKKYGIWFFIAAAIIGFSRIIAGVHYPSDIAGGFILGVFVVCTTFYLARKLLTQKIA